MDCNGVQQRAQVDGEHNRVAQQIRQSGQPIKSSATASHEFASTRGHSGLSSCTSTPSATPLFALVDANASVCPVSDKQMASCTQYSAGSWRLESLSLSDSALLEWPHRGDSIAFLPCHPKYARLF